MNFSHALERLKLGSRMTNPETMPATCFIALHRGYPQGIAINREMARAIQVEEKGVRKFRPYIIQRFRDGSYAPWGPTQTDVLSNLWQQYEDDD